MFHSMRPQEYQKKKNLTWLLMNGRLFNLSFKLWTQVFKTTLTSFMVLDPRLLQNQTELSTLDDQKNI